MIPASAPLPPDVAAAVNAAVARSPAVRLDVHWFPSVTSTMDVASEAVEVGAPEGLVIVADEQTRGRGRRGRSWTSPPGAGLYLSFVFRPPADCSLSLLTLTAGVAVRTAIETATGLPTALKWPNDVMVERRKVAGILAEGLAVGTAAQAVVLGIGINVLRASYPPDIAARATALETELGRSVDRMILLQEVLVTLTDRYDHLRRGDLDDILRAWREASPSAMGATLEWDSVDGVHRGVTSGIDDQGALLVRTTCGIKRVIAGELRWFQ